MSQVLAGIHSIQVLLENSPDDVLELIFQQANKKNKRLAQLELLARKHQIKIAYSDKQILDKICCGVKHQGVIAKRKERRSLNENDLAILFEKLDRPAFFLILDGIQDPHNLGACLRSADAAGVHAVIAPKDNSVAITPTVEKVACGAVESVPLILVTNLVRTMEFLQQKGVWLSGAAAGEEHESLFNADFKGNCGLVIGSEGDGLRRLTREHCDFLVQIPMSGTVESLNASVAAGIFMFEVVRQRQN